MDGHPICKSASPPQHWHGQEKLDSKLAELEAILLESDPIYIRMWQSRTLIWCCYAVLVLVLVQPKQIAKGRQAGLEWTCFSWPVMNAPSCHQLYSTHKFCDLHSHQHRTQPVCVSFRSWPCRPMCMLANKVIHKESISTVKILNRKSPWHIHALL
jgi:hypothetical protein